VTYFLRRKKTKITVSEHFVAAVLLRIHFMEMKKPKFKMKIIKDLRFLFFLELRNLFII